MSTTTCSTHPLHDQAIISFRFSSEVADNRSKAVAPSAMSGMVFVQEEEEQEEDVGAVVAGDRDAVVHSDPAPRSSASVSDDGSSGCVVPRVAPQRPASAGRRTLRVSTTGLDVEDAVVRTPFKDAGPSSLPSATQSSAPAPYVMTPGSTR